MTRRHGGAGRTDKQIVLDANELAREFYRLFGFQSPELFRFDQAKGPREQLMWKLACAAYEMIDHTDVTDALNNLEGG